MPRGQPGRRAQPASTDTPWIFAGGMLAVLMLLGLVAWAGAAADPGVRSVAGGVDPRAIITAFASGQASVGGIQMLVTGGLLAVLAVLGAGVVIGALRSRKGRSRVDDKARSMARASDVAELTEERAAADADRLGAESAGIGVPLARHVPSRRRLFSPWEWVQIWFMGPRAGKTSCVCIPQILETAGPVIATSNKRDIVDLTRGPRSENGVTWVHDVQDIIGERPSWWWNPLSFVTDTETAQKLADVFISSETSAGARQDAYFESAGKETLVRLFLAAAVGGRPITDVFTWANNPAPEYYREENVVNPVELLRAGGRQRDAEGLLETQRLTEKQRDGVFGTLRPWISVLGNERIHPWIVAEPGDERPQFNPHDFVNSTDTLYLVSREGGGSARAISAALMIAVFYEAERIGARQPGGRLKTPLVAVLDEVANVVRWRELPDVYSHYGSRGIIVSTFFQSWAQGVEAFGENGIAKMWSAANVRGVGAGLAEEKFLPFVSTLVGSHDVERRTSQTQKMGRSVSTSVARETLFETSELASLPRGRAVLMASGMPAALVALEHFSEKAYADKVRASEDYYRAQAQKASAADE